MDSNARGEVVEVTRRLIPAGANANAKDSQSRTAADIAAARTSLKRIIAGLASARDLG
jgi:hypothetical protein